MFDIFPSNMGPHLRYLKLERELYDVTKQRMEEPVASVAGAQPVTWEGAQLRASVRDFQTVTNWMVFLWENPITMDDWGIFSMTLMILLDGVW